MDIFILRHGDANVGSKSLMSDSERPLSESGLKEASAAAKMFSELGISFECIFTSPLKRARQTADQVLKHQKKAKLVETDLLKPEGQEEQVAAMLATQKEATILVVGHNPLLVNLINHITGAGGGGAVLIKTGGVAKIKVNSRRPKLGGDIEWLLAPKLIRKISK